MLHALFETQLLRQAVMQLSTDMIIVLLILSLRSTIVFLVVLVDIEFKLPLERPDDLRIRYRPTT